MGVGGVTRHRNDLIWDSCFYFSLSLICMSFFHHAYDYDALLEMASITLGPVRCWTHVDFPRNAPKYMSDSGAAPNPSLLSSPLLSHRTSRLCTVTRRVVERGKKKRAVSTAELSEKSYPFPQTNCRFVYVLGTSTADCFRREFRRLKIYVIRFFMLHIALRR